MRRVGVSLFFLWLGACRSEPLDQTDAALVVDLGARDLVTSVERPFDLSTTSAPFVGNWREDFEHECGLHDEVDPYVSIEEIFFKKDGTFTVTWHPFETYVDYWGTYEATEDGTDGEHGMISMTITGGNVMVPDFDGFGRWELLHRKGCTGSRCADLRLEQMWLGKPPVLPADLGYVPRCGHTLREQ